MGCMHWLDVRNGNHLEAMAMVKGYKSMFCTYRSSPVHSLPRRQPRHSRARTYLSA